MKRLLLIITFISSPVLAGNRYWVGGGANWDQVTTTNWAASSGGAGGQSVPVASDDVFVDANSGAGTITLTANGQCRSLQSSGSSITTFVHNASVLLTIGDGTAGANNIALDLSGFTTYTLGSGSTSNMTFASTSATQQTINSGGFTFAITTFNGVGGSWILTNTLNDGTNNIVLTNGTFNTGGFAVTTGSFSPGTGTTFTANTSILNFNRTGAGSFWSPSSGATISAAAATFVVATTSANGRTFAGGTRTYGTLTYIVAGSAGSMTISGTNSFGTINFSDSSNARTIIFPASVTTTIRDSFNVVGSPGLLMTINSSSAGTTATLYKNGGGQIKTDYLSIQDSTAANGVLWYAGSHSTNVSNNMGWIFGNPPQVGIFGGSLYIGGGMMTIR